MQLPLSSPKIENLSQEDWLELHFAKDHVSASQVSSILNYNKWCNGYTLWAQKAGIFPWSKESFLMTLGHFAEEPIAKKYEKETGRTCTDYGDFAIIRHPEYPWLFATLDREAERHGGEKGAIEIKLSTQTGSWNEVERGPLMYQIQNQIQMHCGGYSWGALVGQIGRTYDQYHAYEFERDDAFFDWMIPKIKEFRYQCMNNIEPEAKEYFEQYASIVKILHPEDSGKTIELSPEQVECARAYTIANAQIKELKRQQDGHKFRIQREMKDASFGDCGDSGIVKWVTRRDGTRVMTIKVATPEGE